MLENTWTETDCRLDVLRATKGAHVEVYECVVKNFLSYIKKICLYSFYSSFLVIKFVIRKNFMLIVYYMYHTL